MAILKESLSLVIYEDTNANNNPLFRYVDWRKTTPSVEVTNPLSRRYTLPPDSSLLVFSGVQTTSIDGTSTFSISLNPVLASTYRITHTGGTAPAFRTDRALTLSGSTITVAVNNNATATFTTSAGSFLAVQVGDVVFVPTAATGDAVSPFSALNGGYWVVLARIAATVTLARPAGVGFSGVSEAVLLTANSQLQAFSSAGVQVGDTIEISAGFSPITQKAFVVSSVTPSRVEFMSAESLPLETGIMPGAAGMIFYNDAKRFLRIEVDQEAAVRLNGDTSNNVRLSPIAISDENNVAWMESWGTSWSLEVVNRSRSNSMSLVVISCE